MQENNSYNNDKARLQKLSQELVKFKEEEQTQRTHLDSLLIEHSSVETLKKEIQLDLNEVQNTYENLNKTYNSSLNDYTVSVLQLNKLVSSIADFKNKKTQVNASVTCPRSVNLSCEDGSTPVAVLDSYSRVGSNNDSFVVAVSSDSLPKLQAI